MLIATNQLGGVTFKNLYELIVHCDCEVIGNIDEYLFPHIFNNQNKVDEILWHLKFKNNKTEVARAFGKLINQPFSPDYFVTTSSIWQDIVGQFAIPKGMI
jgi:hypothetical protein